MSEYTWPVTMLEEYNVSAEILEFFQGFVKGSEDKSKKLEELNSEHQLLKDTSAKQERYIAELEKQIGILQKTLDLVDKNEPRFIVKPKAASSADIADMLNMRPVLNTETVSITPIQDQWIPVTKMLPKVGVRVLIFDSYHGVSIGKALGVASPTMRRIEMVAENDAMYYTEITHWMPLPQPPKGE